MNTEHEEILRTLRVFVFVKMDELDGHATRSMILWCLLRKQGYSQASNDNYRALLEVHDVDVYLQCFASRADEGIRV